MGFGGLGAGEGVWSSYSCPRDLGFEYECEDGAVDVKYAGSSGSESLSERYLPYWVKN